MFCEILRMECFDLFLRYSSRELKSLIGVAAFNHPMQGVECAIISHLHYFLV